RKYKITAYDEKNHTGDIRHIIVRRGHFTGELMIVLVTNSFVFPHAQEIVTDIQKELPEVVSVIQNINYDKTNVILGKQAKVLFEQEYYVNQQMKRSFKISHHSFY